MFGGYNRFGTGSLIKRTFRNLPAHEVIRIYGKYHILDAWELFQDELFYVYVDGVSAFKRGFDHNGNNAVPSICGTSGTAYGD